MGWCSATMIFDAVCTAMFEKDLDDKAKKDLLIAIINKLQGEDWDCEMESKYITHPLVRAAFLELEPDFFD